MRTFRLTIAKVGEQLFSGEVQSVTLPGKEGVFQVLAGHEPVVATLREGEARIVDNAGEAHTLPVTDGGIAEVTREQATVLL